MALIEVSGISLTRQFAIRLRRNCEHTTHMSASAHLCGSLSSKQSFVGWSSYWQSSFHQAAGDAWMPEDRQHGRHIHNVTATWLHLGIWVDIMKESIKGAGWRNTFRWRICKFRVSGDRIRQNAVQKWVFEYWLRICWLTQLEVHRCVTTKSYCDFTSLVDK